MRLPGSHSLLPVDGPALRCNSGMAAAAPSVEPLLFLPVAPLPRPWSVTARRMQAAYPAH